MAQPQGSTPARWGEALPYERYVGRWSRRVAWNDAGLTRVEVRAIQVQTHFADFDDYWQPFLGGQGAAPTWLAGLAPHQQNDIRDRLQRGLPMDASGSIHLTATAWAVKGTR